ncbi:MAG: ParB N-terminal domain-containing protein [Planctomycetaceae bacterium]|nr:ParB N-terminal domain-containing protein [Planctomycetaceae bacterium]
MQLQRLPISDLRPAPYNPRITLHPGDAAFEKLKRSLAEFDLVQPIVWNRRTGHVVGGHQRLEVLKYQGETEVDCVVVDLPLEREKALNITLNNASVASDWDPDKLVDLLEDLHDLPDFDATLTGFDEQELQDLLLAPATSDSERLSPLSNPDEAIQIVRAILEIPVDRWDDIRSRLDKLLAEEPMIHLHLRMPRSMDSIAS